MAQRQFPRRDEHFSYDFEGEFQVDKGEKKTFSAKGPVYTNAQRFHREWHTQESLCFASLNAQGWVFCTGVNSATIY